MSRTDKTKLRQAMLTKDYPTVSNILSKEYSIKAGIQVLEHGCEIGDDELVKIAQKNTIRIIRHVNKKKKLFQMICSKGFSNVAQVLLEQGCPINEEDSHSALIIAIKNGHSYVVKVLLENGVKVDPLSYRIGSKVRMAHNEHGQVQSVLLLASEIGHAEIVEILLNSGAKVNVQDDSMKSALMQASKYGHAEVVEILLENKAPVNMQDDDG